MKTRNDPRHLSRMKTMQALFAYEFGSKKSYVYENVTPIIEQLDRIDSIIEKSAPAFPTEKIARVDLSILRLAIFELLIVKKNPPKVIIDEAIELAKEFGGETSGSFVNGVLGSVLEKIHGNKNN